MKIAALTALAMVAFAANSVITRLALSPVSAELYGAQISAGQFALIRLLSGAVVLALLCMAAKNRASLSDVWRAGHWRGGASLFAYAACFSFAYIALPSGVGALILFGCVQLTMLGAGFGMGERLAAAQWAGVAAAVSGLIWMLLPQGDAASFPLWATGLMAVSGAAWGIYSLLGKGIKTPGPTQRTAGQFARGCVIAAVVLPMIIYWQSPEMPNLRGVILAVICGGVTSGLGYAIWYSALRGLTASRAAIAQLTVPVLAALGGMLFIAEPITLRFVLSSALVLGGVGAAMLVPRRETGGAS